VGAEEVCNFWAEADASEVAANLVALTAAEMGWNPASSAYLDLIDVYCDANLNGFIDPEERRSSNYAWQFGEGAGPPALRCAADAGFRFEDGR